MAVRQSKRKLGLAEESGGWGSRWEGEWFADNGSGGPSAGFATFWRIDTAGKARLAAYPVVGNTIIIARKANQQGRKLLFVNNRSLHNYLSIWISKMQQGHVSKNGLIRKIRLSHPSTGDPLDLNHRRRTAGNSLTAHLQRSQPSIPGSTQAVFREGQPYKRRHPRQPERLTGVARLYRS